MELMYNNFLICKSLHTGRNKQGLFEVVWMCPVPPGFAVLGSFVA
jgi:hypothetical protein